MAVWLTQVVTDLKKVLWVRMNDPVISLLWSRLSRLVKRFHTLVARLDAGLPAPPRRQRPKRPARAPPEPGAVRIPGGRFWLIGMFKHLAAAYGYQLQLLLADPRVAALLAAAPEAGRILRPLCHLLAVYPEGALALPANRGKPEPRRRPAKRPPPHPPQSAMAQLCAAFAARTPGAMTVTTNFAPPRRKPPWWSTGR